MPLQLIETIDEPAFRAMVQGKLFDPSNAHRDGTQVTDLTHFLEEEGDIGRVSVLARCVAESFAAFVEMASYRDLVILFNLGLAPATGPESLPRND